MADWDCGDDNGTCMDCPGRVDEGVTRWQLPEKWIAVRTKYGWEEKGEKGSGVGGAVKGKISLLVISLSSFKIFKCYDRWS
jgi:hypothetical protein